MVQEILRRRFEHFSSGVGASDLIRAEMRGKLPKDVRIDENTRLDELGMSSLQISEVVFTLEGEHGVDFDPARAANRTSTRPTSGSHWPPPAPASPIARSSSVGTAPNSWQA